MEVSPKEIRYYATALGRIPFKHWLSGLRDDRAVSKVNIRLVRLANGNMGDCRKAGEGVLELRVDYGPGYRVYFGQDGPRIILLLVGGDKKTQDRDIQLARHYWEDYKNRK